MSSAFSYEEKFRSTKKATATAPVPDTFKAIRSIDHITKVYVNNFGSGRTQTNLVPIRSDLTKNVNKIRKDHQFLPRKAYTSERRFSCNTHQLSSLKLLSLFTCLLNKEDENQEHRIPSSLKPILPSHSSLENLTKSDRDTLDYDTENHHQTLSTYFSLAHQQNYLSSAGSQRSAKSTSSGLDHSLPLRTPQSKNRVDSNTKLQKNDENSMSHNRSETTQAHSDDLFPTAEQPQQQQQQQQQLNAFPPSVPRQNSLMLRQKAQLQRYEMCFNNPKNNQNESHIQEEDDDDDEAAVAAANLFQINQSAQDQNAHHIFKDDDIDLSAINGAGTNTITGTKYPNRDIQKPKQDLLSILDQLELQDYTLTQTHGLQQQSSSANNNIKRSSSMNWTPSGKWGSRKPAAISQKSIKTLNLVGVQQENNKPRFLESSESKLARQNHKINNVTQMMKFGMTSSGQFFNGSDKWRQPEQQNQQYVKPTAGSNTLPQAYPTQATNQQYFQEIMELKKRLRKQSFGLRPLHF